MTKFLVSVTSTEEAMVAIECGADIIDLKDPVQGALGALSMDTVQNIVAFVDALGAHNKKTISATIGDLPMIPTLLFERVSALSKIKVDIVKIGFFQDDDQLPDYQACLEVLKPDADSGILLIAVLFLEQSYPEWLIDAIINTGFHGVMFDTAHKNGKTFLDYISIKDLKKTAEKIQARKMLFGLAGSLHLQHLPMIRKIEPDYAGFRGGVCVNHQRVAKLDRIKIQEIRKSLYLLL